MNSINHLVSDKSLYMCMLGEYKWWPIGLPVGSRNCSYSSCSRRVPTHLLQLHTRQVQHCVNAHLNAIRSATFQQGLSSGIIHRQFSSHSLWMFHPVCEFVHGPIGSLPMCWSILGIIIRVCSVHGLDKLPLKREITSTDDNSWRSAASLNRNGRSESIVCTE